MVCFSCSTNQRTDDHQILMYYLDLGSLQPDEDDYGYVSKDAEDLYNKLINKYNSMPAEESVFKKTTTKSSQDILNTKVRLRTGSYP